jgi:hypothetical protein
MYYNHDNDNNKLCRKCWRHYYYNLLLAAEFRLTRLSTHKKQFYFKHQKLRTGICQDCKKVKLTGLHHEKFDESNPLANTRELCQSCHDKEGWRLGQITGRRIKVVQ